MVYNKHRCPACLETWTHDFCSTTYLENSFCPPCALKDDVPEDNVSETERLTALKNGGIQMSF